MIDQQLLDYIKKQLEQGVSRDQIRNTLFANNWQEKAVDEAFAFIENPQTVPQPPQARISLPSVSEHFAHAWQIYKNRFGTLLAIHILPTLAMSVLFAVLFGGSITAILLSGQLPETRNLILMVIVGLILVIVTVVVQAWSQLALIYVIKDPHEKIGIKEAFKRAWPKVWAYWGIALLAGFITMGGVFLLIIPGIILGFWFSMALYILVAEDIKGMNALLKSKEYVRGKFGYIYGRILLVGLASMVIGGIAASVTESQLLTTAINLLLTPFMLVYVYLMYTYLKAHKGAFDFNPTKSQKLPYLLIGAFGILVVCGIAYALIHLGNTLPAQYQAVRAKQQTEINTSTR